MFISNENVYIISFYVDELDYYMTIDKNIDKNELYSVIKKTKDIATS